MNIDHIYLRELHIYALICDLSLIGAWVFNSCKLFGHPIPHGHHTSLTCEDFKYNQLFDRLAPRGYTNWSNPSFDSSNFGVSASLPLLDDDCLCELRTDRVCRFGVGHRQRHRREHSDAFCVLRCLRTEAFAWTGLCGHRRRQLPSHPNRQRTPHAGIRSTLSLRWGLVACIAGAPTRWR